MKLKSKQSKKLIFGAAFILFLFTVFMYPQLSRNATANQIYTSPTPTYYNPTFAPSPTVNTFATIAPTIAPLPTMEPTWFQVDVAPSSISYGNPAYITVTSDQGDFYVNLYIESVNPMHTWANMVIPVWVDSSTNTGTYEMLKTSDGYYFPPDAQYNIHVEWDDESSNTDSVWISLV